MASIFVVATGAQAKAPPNGFRICGDQEQCVAVGQDDAERLAISILYGGGSTEIPTPLGTSGYFVLRWQSDAGEPRSAYFVPAMNAVRLVADGISGASNYFSPRWLRLEAVAQSTLAAATRPLEPIAPQAPVRVTVAGKLVRDPASYALLWSIGTPVHSSSPAGWLRVRMAAEVASPWADAGSDIRVSRQGALLLRDSTVFRVPRAVAMRVRRASLRSQIR